MNITVVSLWAHKLFNPAESQPFGGAEIQLFLLSEELARRSDVRIRFITRGSGPPETFTCNEMQVYKLAHRPTSFGRAFRGTWDLFQTLISLDTDCFIQRGGGIETGLTGFASRWSGKPFLFMTSSIWDVDGTHSGKRGLFYGSMYKFGLHRAAWVVSQTQIQSKLLLQNYGVKNTVLHSVHRIPETIPSEKSGVLWVGRCEPLKRPEALLRLAEATPALSFTMVCPEANSRDYFEQITQRASALKNLVFLPGVSFEETEQLFARHRLYLNTSDTEGFPNTYVQAFKWGTPVVSLFINPDQILTANQIGICTDGDETALQAAVLGLYRNDREWQEYSCRARDYAWENHDVKTIAEQLYRIIQKTVQP